MTGVGTTVGNYRLTGKLGSGAMGTVFTAEHLRDGSRAALKIIHPDLASKAEMVSRFFTEARAVSQIGHDHIVRVFDFGQTPDGDNFIAMELLEGKNLGQRLQVEKILDEKTALHIAAQIADGLAASHSHGIVHRDLKPDNIFLIQRGDDATFVKILDFGLAKLTRSDDVAHKTRTGSVLGTPHYMAPEQCEGKPDIDGRVDVYALGCLLYEMLCGRVPFPGDGFGEVLVRHLREPPQPPTRLNTKLSKAAEKVVLHALAKKREFRFQTMQEFRAALRDPERYSSALDGDRPIHTSTFERLSAPDLPAESTIPDAITPEPPTPKNIPVRYPTAKVPSIADTVQRSKSVERASRRTAVLTAAVALPIVAIAAWFALRSATPPEPAGPSATQNSDVASVVVNSEPIGATVLRDGAPIGRTPLVLKMPITAPPVEIRLSKAGFLDLTYRVRPNEQAIVLKLSPVPHEPPTPPTPPVAARAPASSAAARPTAAPARPPFNRRPQAVRPPQPARPTAPRKTEAGDTPIAKPKSPPSRFDGVLEPEF